MNRIGAGIIGILILCGSAYAQGGSQIAGGSYFSVYGDSQSDAYAVLGKIDANYLVYSANGTQVSDSVGDMLGKSLDGLYQEVSDILDIHIYSFKGSIRVFPDRPALTNYFKQTYAVDFNERSIYYFEKDTIFISLADMTVGMLGHEIAHAIISHYFVVPPPAKIQEVLCGYVEYSLRKSRGTLP